MSEVNEHPPTGTPTWVDLHVPDVEAAKDYYGRVFGWSYRESALGTECLLRGQPVAGMRTGTGGWRVHLATDDCDATVRAVVAAGGTITEEPAVFGFTLDGNPNVDFDFTFLRLPDGHEVGGIMGLPGAPSGWNTTFEVTDTDTTLAKAGATVTPDDTIYGRSATFHDPFGVELTIIARP